MQILDRTAEHHWHGPSSRYIGRLCPGSGPLRRDHKWRRRAEDYTEEGSLIHQWAAQPPDAIVGAREAGTITERVAGHAIACRGYADEWTRGADSWFREQRIEMIDEVPGGTPDVVAVYGDHVRIVEFKAGYEEVPAEILLPQMEHQAFLAMRRYSRPKAICRAYQPEFDTAVDCGEFTDSEAIRQKILEEKAACEKPDAPFVPGRLQCRWCEAVYRCPAANGVVRKLVQFVGRGRVKRAVIEEMVSQLSTETLVEQLDAIDVAEIFCEAARKRLKDVLSSGFALPGLKLRTSKGRKTVRDSVAAFDALKTLLPPAVIWSTLRMSLSEAKDRFYEEASRRVPEITRKEADAWFFELLDGIVVEGEPVVSMVRDNGKEG